MEPCDYAAAGASIPLTILTGFLGAGKTTLLNRILSGDHGLRVAVLVNDFGAINIDADLVVGITGDVISLANGCICCSLRDDLVEAVLQTIARPERPEYILLEASGVADPAGITLAFHTPRLRDRIRLDSVTCVLDAQQLFAYPDYPELLQLQLHQIAFADMVILNKVDLASPETLRRIHGLIDDHFNNIRLVETSYCDVPYEILLGVGRFDPARLMTAAAPNGEHRHHTTRPAFDTWSFETDRPLSLAALEGAAQRLPGGVFRCKGIVYLAEEPERPAVLQVVCRRVEITRLAGWERQRPATRIVTISAPGSVDRDELWRRFAGCLAEPV
ncbi:putative cobalamin biosynthesis protein CobW [Candidatus Promineifilum breve]|uniref:Cobalamin biosynthesis protein CobW n=1 Tax=Candidatus Promineifilum breve TaxID=1806508 RepID=A0A160T3L5_9CHLR|nr:GTP-binding protein [Candidatus Promineifilum breve]CUS03225.2 putative cobalamin biosynthesis protein CobW [Candidatus Promineifilum breve]